MTVSKKLLSAVIALALVPAAAQAASASRAPAQSLSVTPGAQALSLTHPGRVGAKTGKSSHFLGLGVLGSVLVVAGAIAAAVVIADAVSSDSSG